MTNLEANSDALREILELVNALPEAGSGSGGGDGTGSAFATKTITPAVDVVTGDPTSHETSATYFEHGLGVVPNFMCLTALDYDSNKRGNQYLRIVELYCAEIDNVSTYDGIRATTTSATSTTIGCLASPNGSILLTDLVNTGSNHFFTATEEYVVCIGKAGTNATYLQAGTKYVLAVGSV